MSDQGDDDPADGSAPRDVAILGGPTESGDGVQILRLREGQVEVGELRASVEGKPLLGESVRLHPRAADPRVFDVEVLAEGPLAVRRRLAAKAERADAQRPAKGPAKVATESYRSGWDAIFGGSRGGDGHGPN